MHKDVEAAISRARARVTPKTLIQDVSDPLTGTLDKRRIATKLTNLEGAVGDLAEAVEEIDAKLDR